VLPAGHDAFAGQELPGLHLDRHVLGHRQALSGTLFSEVIAVRTDEGPSCHRVLRAVPNHISPSYIVDRQPNRCRAEKPLLTSLFSSPDASRASGATRGTEGEKVELRRGFSRLPGIVGRHAAARKPSRQKSPNRRGDAREFPGLGPETGRGEQRSVGVVAHGPHTFPDEAQQRAGTRQRDLELGVCVSVTQD
jgi:hypothetical protein